MTPPAPLPEPDCHLARLRELIDEGSPLRLPNANSRKAVAWVVFRIGITEAMLALSKEQRDAACHESGRLRAEVERLKEYEWMYQELCK